MAAVRVVDDLSCNTAAAAVLSLATLDKVQRHNRDETDEGSPCAKRTLCSRKRRDEDVCLSTASSSMQTPRTCKEDTQKVSADFCLPYSCVSNASRKSTKEKELDPTDDKEGIQTHPVEYIVDRRSTFSILPIRLHKNWPYTTISSHPSMGLSCPCVTAPLVLWCTLH